MTTKVDSRAVGVKVKIEGKISIQITGLAIVLCIGLIMLRILHVYPLESAGRGSEK